MRYFLDTNASIALFNKTSGPLMARVRRHEPADIGLPAPVAHELYYGAWKTRQMNVFRVLNRGTQPTVFKADTQLDSP